jgi:hypothetical protein
VTAAVGTNSSDASTIGDTSAAAGGGVESERTEVVFVQSVKALAPSSTTASSLSSSSSAEEAAKDGSIGGDGDMLIEITAEDKHEGSGSVTVFVLKAERANHTRRLLKEFRGQGLHERQLAVARSRLKKEARASADTMLLLRQGQAREEQLKRQLAQQSALVDQAAIIIEDEREIQHQEVLSLKQVLASQSACAVARLAVAEVNAVVARVDGVVAGALKSFAEQRSLAMEAKLAEMQKAVDDQNRELERRQWEMQAMKADQQAKQLAGELALAQLQLQLKSQEMEMKQQENGKNEKSAKEDEKAETGETHKREDEAKGAGSAKSMVPAEGLVSSSPPPVSSPPSPASPFTTPSERVGGTKLATTTAAASSGARVVEKQLAEHLGQWFPPHPPPPPFLIAVSIPGNTVVASFELGGLASVFALPTTSLLLVLLWPRALSVTGTRVSACNRATAQPRNRTHTPHTRTLCVHANMHTPTRAHTVCSGHGRSGNGRRRWIGSHPGSHACFKSEFRCTIVA